MLSIPSDTAFAEAQRLIDDECHSCEKRLLPLKTQRNTYTSIAKIPDELLLEILTTLENTLAPGLWLRATHVCRHWRRVTTQAPTLWTNVPTHVNPNLTLLYLARSVPLALDVKFDSRTSTDAAFSVLRDVQRIRAFCLSGFILTGFFARMQTFLLDLGHEAPMLRILRITPQLSPHTRYQLSASTFGRPLLLQHLHLQCIDFDWAMLPIATLTTLSLQHMKMTSALPWETFYRTLAAMPLLKKLCLHFAGLQLHSGSPGGINPIWLPCLVTLNIAKASEADILSFLSTTMMPSLEQVDLTREAQDHDGYTAIIRAISSLVKRGNFGTLDELHFFDNEFSLFSCLPHGRKYITYHHPGRLTGPGDTAAQLVMELLSGICAPANGGNPTLKRATLGVFQEPCTMIVEIFALLPSLESINVADKMTIPFLNSLNIPISAAKDTQLPFLNLRSLTFNASWDIVLGAETVFCDELFDMFLDCMMQRCECNAPIAALSIPWVISKKQFESLKQAVANVTFGYPGAVKLEDNT